MRIVEYLLFNPGPVGAVFDRWGSVLFGAYVALGVALVVLCGTMRALNGRHGLKNRVADRILMWGLGLQLLGVLALGLRVMQWPLVSMRLLLFLQLAAEVVAMVYLVRWMQNRYPILLAAYEWEEKRRSYLPRAVGGAVEPARRRTGARRRR